jgi:hypothetical protein
MKNIYLEATKTSPKIILNDKTNIIDIEGDSYPEDSFEFYEPILEWITMYLALASEEVTVKFNIPYLNSSSLKVIYSLFVSLEKAVKNGKKVNITWTYDRENDMSLEDGEEFRDSFTILNIKLSETS